MVRYPDWCCQHCGEPLRTVPCLNCIQLGEMETRADRPAGGVLIRRSE